ncbi:hypothetical protein ACH5RR_031658 [Cinchona calisaya]|uniref:Uncharacterized protein n=1 Tax=Cinchona calisaya TaxID=153742 RepID=A0ABD2YHT6_9GENT
MVWHSRDFRESSIDPKLSGPSTTTSSVQCIFRVHDRLRSHEKEAYEPQVLSIGPYHYSKPNLKKMEMHKQRYLEELLLQREETNRDGCISALTELEDRARKCYAEDISEIKKDDFVEMLLLDGCFIIQFLRKLYDPKLRNGDDTIFQMDWLRNWIEIDLILFENQIPFFILEKLFVMTTLPGQAVDLVGLALPLRNCLRSDLIPTSSDKNFSANGFFHLLDLVHKSLCSSFAETLTQNNDPAVNDFSVQELEFIKSTSELQKSGVHFKAVEASQNQSWLDITFKDGKIKIPKLKIMDWTESVFRNLIAYEEYMLNSQSWRCVSDYTMFLDRLIDSPRDVAGLRHGQIIENWLGDDEAVSTMFNKLGNDVGINDSKFCYSRVLKDVNKYSVNCWNIWWAHLMRNYFNTPWSIISFLAALLLLILTIVQTIFSILQYTNQ